MRQLFLGSCLMIACLGGGCAGPEQAPEETSAGADTSALRSVERRAGELPPAVIGLRASCHTLSTREERNTERVSVQHILVAVAGSPSMPQVTRTAVEAEALAAELYAEAVAGSDFDALMHTHSDDVGAGTYTITIGEPVSGAYPRHMMERGFGDVAWRLDVGGIGVVPFDEQASPHGWHILLRLE